MFDFLSEFPLWERILNYSVLIIVAIAFLYCVYLTIEYTLYLRRIEELKRREERRNLRSPAWADTMLYWRTEE